VTVFAGDFNVNLRGRNLVALARVQGLRLSGVRQVPISPIPVNNPPSRYHRRLRAAPGGYRTTQLLDWALVRYGQGAAPGVPQPMLVVDRVTGITAPGGLPTFTSHMATRLNVIRQLPGQLSTSVRLGGESYHSTTKSHGLQRGDRVTIAGVLDQSFDGTFTVRHVSNGLLFSVAQPGRPNMTSEGGTATSAQAANRVFRQMENFGHIGPLGGGMGTSDHLPVFFIV
jgi:hypothetical protein